MALITNSSKSLRKISLIYLLFYIGTIALWNSLWGSNNPLRYLFYLIIIVSMIVFCLRNKIKKNELLFFILAIYCTMNYIIFDNSNTSGFLSLLFPYVFMPLSIFSFLFLTKGIDIKWIIKSVVWINTIIAILAILEFFTGRFFLGIRHASFLTASITMNRTRVFADNDLTLGCQLAVSAIYAFSLCKGNKKGIYITLTIINILGMLTTGARGPMVGCIAGIGVYLLLVIGHKRNGKNVVLFILISTIAIIVVFNYITSGNIRVDPSKNPILFRVLSTFNWSTEAGNLGRMDKWEYYLADFWKRPLFGYGIGYTESTTRGVTESGLLQQLIEIGIVGTVLYYWVIIKVMIDAVKITRLNESQDNDIYIIASISAIIAILVENLVLQIFISTIIGVLFWISFTLIYKTTYRREN